MGELKIYSPELVDFGESVRLQSRFEVNGKQDILWYEVKKRYGEYLTLERADAFLIGLLLLALKGGYDIRISSVLSERLYYQVTKYLIPLLSQIHGYKKIKIYCEKTSSEVLPCGGGVGTGLSCGIDSFSTIYDHLAKTNDVDSHEITHYTFFNVGSHGSLGGEKAYTLFKKREVIVKSCAEELGKELISVDSNLSELLQMNFKETHTFRSMSATLALQKLFNVYYYSSGYHIKTFHLSKISPLIMIFLV